MDDQLSTSPVGNDNSAVYSNLLNEIEYNQRIASPAPGVKGCKTQLKVAYFESIKHTIDSLPHDLSRKLRSVYRDITEENQYIAKIESMGFDRFRREFPMEWLQWSRTCIILEGSLKGLSIALRSKIAALQTQK